MSDNENNENNNGGCGKAVAVLFGLILIVLAFVIALSPNTCSTESCITIKATGTGTIKLIPEK